MEHVVQYRIKAIDDITPVQRRVNALNQQSQTGFKHLGSKIDQVNAPARRLLGNLKNVGTQGVKAPGALMAGFGKLNTFLSGPMLATMGGVFAIGRMAAFGRGVVDTLSKFERFDAVLTNTLGSNSAAKRVMDDIVNLAANTPFEVDGLTDSWVRLANQGFRPTMTQMTSLGDLASSTGKDMMMLTEAIIDAQVGENERLKEFGIRAEQSGKKTIFTFKGVRTEVDRNARSIQEYILSLGKLKGVSGAMAAISKTTGGLLSNLQDKYTQLKLTIGKGLKPVIEGMIEFIGKLIDRFNHHAKWLQTNEELVRRFTTNALTKLWNMVEHVGKVIGEMIGFWQKNGSTIMEFWGIIAKVVPPIIKLIMMISKVVMDMYKIFYDVFLLQIKGFVDLWNSVSDFFGKSEKRTNQWNTYVKDNDPFSWAKEAKERTLPELNKAIEETTSKWEFNANKWTEFGLANMLGPLKGFVDFFRPGFKFGEYEVASSKVSSEVDRASTRRNFGLKTTQAFASGIDPATGLLIGPGTSFVPGVSNRFLPKHLLPGYIDTNSSDAGSIYGSPEAPGGSPSSGQGKKLSDRATDVKGVSSGHINHITLNIQKLVESLIIKTEKIGMSDQQVKTHFTRLLLSAVNDTQQSY